MGNALVPRLLDFLRHRILERASSVDATQWIERFRESYCQIRHKLTYRPRQIPPCPRRRPLPRVPDANSSSRDYTLLNAGSRLLGVRPAIAPQRLPRLEHRYAGPMTGDGGWHTADSIPDVSRACR